VKPPTIQTVGALREKGYRSRSVKQELSENLHGGSRQMAVFEKYGKPADLEAVVQAFADESVSIEIGDEVATGDFVNSVDRIADLRKGAAKLCAALEQPADSPAHLAAAAEFIREALHVNNRLSKYAYHGRTYFKR
jgi:hypothetical protein